MKRGLIGAAALSVMLVIPGLARAQFNLTTLDVPFPNSGNTNINGVTTNNAMVGQFDQFDNDGNYITTHGFVYSKGQFTQIDAPGAQYTSANGISPNGDITGWYRDPVIPGSRHGYLLSNGVFTILDAPGAVRTYATSMNSRREVVGFTIDANGVWHAFTWFKGEFTIFDVPGATRSRLDGINDQGDVIGDYFNDVDGTHNGFIRSKDGTFTILEVPGSLGTNGQGITNSGIAVGMWWFGDPDNPLVFGFVLTAAGYTKVQMGDSTDTELFCISNNGTITGTYLGDDGFYHGLVGTPAHP
jgi:uncharacterized membrane protein